MGGIRLVVNGSVSMEKLHKVKKMEIKNPSTREITPERRVVYF